MGRIIHVVQKFLVAVFGAIQWQPPRWLHWIFDHVIARLGHMIFRLYPQGKRRRNILISILVVLTVSLGILYAQYEPEKVFDLPPLKVSATLVPPGLKQIGEEYPPRPLIVRFNESTARIEQVDKEIANTELMKLSPAIHGKWRWSGDRELQFVPDQDWPVSTTYELEIREGFVRDDILIDALEFEFTTEPFTAQLSGMRFFQDEASADVKKVAAQVRFSHPVNMDGFKQRVHFLLEKDADTAVQYPFEVEFDKAHVTAHIRSGNIPIPAKDNLMKIRIDKGIQAAAGGKGTDNELTGAATVPGMYTYFRVLDLDLGFARNEKNEPGRVLVIETKVQVHEKELAENLKAWILPKENRDRDGDGLDDPDYTPQKDAYYWQTNQIDRKVLAKSQPVKLEHIPNEREYSKVHSFKISAPTGRFLYVKLDKGTRSFGGYILADAWEDIRETSEFPRELSIMHDGAILTANGNKKLSLTTRGLNGIYLEFWRILPGELNHFITQTSDSFSQTRFRNYNFDEKNLGELFTEKRELNGSNPSKTQYTTADFGKYLNATTTGMAHGLFILKANAWDPAEDAIRNPSDRRVVLITDMGIIEKRDAEKNVHVFVQSVKDGGPKAGARVEILGKNGQPLFVRHTNADGYVVFPPLEEYSMEKSPIAIVAHQGDDFSFLPFDRYDRNLNYSSFDIGGVHNDGSPDKLRAFLFSERGIYRPGDPIHIGVIARASDWTIPVDGIPLEVSISDPRGVDVFRERMALTKEGFIEFDYTTQESSPTGAYNVSAHLIRDDVAYTSIGFTSVRVEEFLPDKMRIRTELLPVSGNGWVPPENIRARVTLQNLYGTPASDRMVKGQYILQARYPRFEGFGDYTFFDAAKADESYSQALTPIQTDENGEAAFDIDLTAHRNATYTLSFYAEGFEGGGGRSVSSRATIMVSPMDYVVGYKTDGGSLYGIHRDAKRELHFIALNAGLDKTVANGLTGTLIQKRYVSTLVRMSSGTYKYQSVEKKVKVSQSKIRIGKEGLTFSLPTETPGEFEFSLVDNADHEVANIPFSIAGASNESGNLERNAKLEISLDKKDYSAGDTISVSVKAPYAGSGLITIERDKVLAYKWFSTTTRQSVQTIEVPSDVDVNAYVNVAFVRDYHSDEVFVSPLCYAAANFFVTRDARTHTIDLDVPEMVKPGEALSIGVATDIPSKIAVFAVDEGILQVANYQPPEPLEYFLAKRALEIDTRQILDLILPEQKTFSSLSTPGAGEDEDALGQNLNPFKRKRDKPVVYWSGIVDASSEKQTLTYSVPDYFNGSLRVMAVAVSETRMGATDDRVTVKGPFVIQPSTPLFAVPGDQFEVSAVVANNIAGSGRNATVTVEMAVSEHLQAISAKSVSINIPEGREKTVRFMVKAAHEPGGATITFTATHKKETTAFRTSLSVRPGSPHTTTLMAGMVDGGSTSIPIKRDLYAEYRKLAVSVSPLPLALADGLMAYLEKFPHGCTEQIVSQTVPALVLGDHPEFGFDKSAVDVAVNRALRILRARQNEDGAFGFWAANSHVSDFQAIWAMQFLTEARERGVRVPYDILDKGLSYLTHIASLDMASLDDARTRTFAIYILARHGKLAPDALAGLREFLDSPAGKGWKKDVTVAYLAAIYQLIQDKAEARRLLSRVDFDVDDASQYASFYDSQTHRGILLYLVANHFPEHLTDVPGEFISRLADTIADGRYNTLSSATLIYGLEAYARRLTSDGDSTRTNNGRVAEVMSDKQQKAVQLTGTLISRGSFSPEAKAIRITGDGDKKLFYQVTVAGFDKDENKDVEIKKGVEILREFQSVEGKPINAVVLGEEVNAVLKLRSVNDTRHYNLAVVDLLPAGFEVVMEHGGGGNSWGRLRQNGSTWNPDYADVREDRVVLYGAVGSDIATYVYRIKAVAEGTFVAPAAFVKSMYDPDVLARTKSAGITVVAQKK